MDTEAVGDELLVAIDFSPGSLRALDLAVRWRGDAAELTVLHVLDRRLAERIEWLGVDTTDAILERMRSHASDELGRILAERGVDRVETMVVVGEPFVEIVKIANDLDCDLIIMGIHGEATGITPLLFGGTAEKVLRAATRPVLCVP